MKLNRQHSSVKTPKDTYRFALNGTTDPERVSSISSEPGNTLCVSFDFPWVGPPIIIDRDRQVVFLSDNSIWIVNTNDCTKTLWARLPCFNWDTLDEKHPVTGTYRNVRGCEDIIYIFDGINKDKFINLSRPEKHKTDGEFDCDKFNFDVQVSHPIIETEILNTGGKLEYGTYNFAIEFLTSNNDSIFVSPVDINYTPIIYQNEGALNISTNLPEIGGRPLSNKSIKITVTGIPEEAILARIIVFRHITSDGLTSDAHVVGESIPISGNTLIYTYRGFNVQNGDYLTDKNEYLVPKTIYQSSFNGLQVDKRLVRYNLKETVEDYSNYQEKASAICSKYVVKEVGKSNNDIYLLNRTFLGGEIILPCIEYVHKDGSISNAYPLIGRQKNSNDEILVDDIFNTGQQVEKWQVFNTAIKDSTPLDGYVSSGEFGYYASDQLYSSPSNYCGENYWGTDCNNGLLEGTPVRLFVVPDRSIEPHEDIDNIYPIGLWFDETTIEYPNNNIIGHYFSVVVVKESNISAKGIGIQTTPYETTTGDFVIRSDNGPVTGIHKDYKFISSRGLINNEYINGDYVSHEGNWDEEIFSIDQEYKKIFESGLPYDQIHVWESDFNNLGYSTVINEPLELVDSYKIPQRSLINGFENRNFTNSIDLLRLSKPFSNNSPYKYLSVKSYINPIPNIFSITTRRITEIGETVSFNGDNFISPLNIESIFDFKIEGVDIIGELINIARFGILSVFIGNEGKDLDAYVDYLYGFFTESKVNTYLRHNGTDGCSKHLQVKKDTLDFFLDKMVEKHIVKYKLRESFCPFFGGYNLDYTAISDYNKYSNISFLFDFCSSCTGLYPNRIIFSLPSFSEDLADGYRINRANDYIDIPSHGGAIIAIDYKDGKLVIRTERACFLLMPNPQQLETNENSVYIGTGDFLSLPSQELSVTPLGYGGQQDKLDSINCEKGLFWCDKSRKEIYHLSNEFKEIHIDLEKWFGDNITNDSLVFTYDPYHERILLTQLNNWTISYCFKYGGWKSWHSYIPDWYMYDVNTFYSVYDNNLWKHDVSQFNNFTNYYGFQFPHILELTIVKEGEIFKPQSIHWRSNTYTFQNGYPENITNITYGQMLAYNNIQSTGIQTLLLDDEESIYYLPTTTHVKQTDNIYKASPLKDLTVSSNIWSTDITSIKQGINQGFNLLLPIVDVNKKEVETGEFKGDYCSVQLIFENKTYKISLEFFNSVMLNSKR